MVTIKELAKLAGVHVRTIAKWQVADLLPKPHIDSGRGGRGRTGYWPDDTVEIVSRIKTLQAEGLSLRQIAEALFSASRHELGTVSDASRSLLQRFDEHRLENGRTVREQLQEDIATHLAGVYAGPRGGAHQLAKWCVEDVPLGYALTLVINGSNPVLVADAFGEKYITPDFLVAHALGFAGRAFALAAEAERTVQLMRQMSAKVVFAMYPLLEHACAKVGRQLPISPSVLPPQVVSVVKHSRDDKKRAEALVQVPYVLLPVGVSPYGPFTFSMNTGATKVERVLHVKPPKRSSTPTRGEAK
jgi:DNA-binding transcriptional MerR regulator